MGRRNAFVKTLCKAARKFRYLQEIYILPWWCNGGLTAIPLWALDCVVLLVKICSTCVAAVIRIMIPPVPKSLHGETVLVTGAARGIGRELALQLADLGATVVCCDINADSNNAVVDEIRRNNGESFAYTVDISAQEQIATVALKIRRQLTDITMVVSNAAVYSAAPLIAMKPDVVLKIIDTNLLAHFWVIQAFLPSMIERRHGHIVAINSSVGLTPCAECVPYCAAKFGLRGLMDSLSEELRLDTWTKDIHTTTVYLGTVDTGFYPTPCHRFTSLYSEITPKDAARIIIEGIRRNDKEISIPSYMKCLISITNLLPYRLRIILVDFFNFGKRSWFRFC